MPSEVSHVRRLQDRIEMIKKDLLSLGEMRPGSLVERYRRCGKPQCHCARPDDRGHGPQWLLTRPVSGKTVSLAIPKEAVERTRRQVEEYQRFRAFARELTEANVLLCDALLHDPRAASEEAAKKGASKSPSRRRSSPRSKRS